MLIVFTYLHLSIFTDASLPLPIFVIFALLPFASIESADSLRARTVDKKLRGISGLQMTRLDFVCRNPVAMPHPDGRQHVF